MFSLWNLRLNAPAINHVNTGKVSSEKHYYIAVLIWFVWGYITSAGFEVSDLRSNINTQLINALSLHKIATISYAFYR